MSLSVSSALDRCEAHKRHSPSHKTIEFHHIIPVAWQLKTVVAVPPYPGMDPNGRGELWDNRGAWLCPTGHRNVHWWIVDLMHAAATANSTDPQVAIDTVQPRRGLLTAEFAIATQALIRYTTESLASLLALTATGEWGQV